MYAHQPEEEEKKKENFENCENPAEEELAEEEPAEKGGLIKKTGTKKGGESSTSEKYATYSININPKSKGPSGGGR